MRDAGDGVVGHGTAEGFVVDGLAGRAFYEVGSAETHEGCVLDHQDHVAQCRKIRASGDAHSHHGGDLRDLQIAAHYRVVIEDPRSAVLSGEDSALVWKIDA